MRKIFSILRWQRKIEPERMAQLLQIFGPRAFAEHLLDGIAGNDMRKKENHGDDKPKRRQGKQNANGNEADHCGSCTFADDLRERFRLVGATATVAASASPLDGTTAASGADFGASDSGGTGAGTGSGLIFTRETRRFSISITVKR